MMWYNELKRKFLAHNNIIYTLISSILKIVYILIFICKKHFPA